MTNFSTKRVRRADGSPTRRTAEGEFEVWTRSGWSLDPEFKPWDFFESGRPMTDEELTRWGVPKSDWDSSRS